MLSKEEVLKIVKEGKKSSTLDGRDYARLISFFPVSQWKAFGFELRNGTDPEEVVVEDWTEENVLNHLRKDVAFGFEKALSKRGISAGLMHEVVKMWLWILDDNLQHLEDYAEYGLPLFKAVSVKYGFDNPIGNDNGDEYKYSMRAYM